MPLRIIAITLGLVATGFVSSYAIDTTTVYEIQQGMFPVGTMVYVDSVIVTAIDLVPTTFGFHVQELNGGPYSGILCYMQYQRPDTVDGVGLEVGDLVKVWGRYGEYNRHSEIEPYVSGGGVRILQKHFAEPACTLLSCADLGYGVGDSTFAEKWEGVLICVDTVQVVAVGSYNEWTVVEYHDHPGSGLGDSLRIDDKLFTLIPPAIGDTLALIRGVYAEEWGNYRLWPRNFDDLVFMGPAPPPHLTIAYATSETSINAVFDKELDEPSAEDVNNYSLATGTTIHQAILDLGTRKTVKLITDPQPLLEVETLTACDIRSLQGTPMDCESWDFMAGITPISAIQTVPDTNDASPLAGYQVTVRGIVTSPSSSFGGPFFMQDAPGAWNGIYIYDPTARVDLGDSVTVSGLVMEYYGLTEIASVDYLKEEANQVRVPEPTLVSCPQCNLAPESYEGVLVKMDSVTVISLPDQYGEWLVQSDDDTCKVGDMAIDFGPGYDYPGFGSLISLTGCYRYSFGEYKIEPRFNDDIYIHEGCTAGVGSPSRFEIISSGPNPVTSETMIKFMLPSETQVHLAIYDVSGRLVTVLKEGTLEAGEHAIRWDARDADGRKVSAGIYLCRLSTSLGSLQRKVAVLR
ncbi:MAG: FlgD immunoglobulin-like domain containing protein [bacterium]